MWKQSLTYGSCGIIKHSLNVIMCLHEFLAQDGTADDLTWLCYAVT